MEKNKTITVKGSEISVLHIEKEDYLSLTDIARHKDSINTDDSINNWLRNRNTVELLGFREQLYNPGFKPVEFDGFRKQAGAKSFAFLYRNGLKQQMQLVSFTIKENFLHSN